MPSFLQKAPNDVLQHIAFLTASSSIFQPPSAALNLSQTCRTVYDAISPKRSPQLYSKIFCVCFDTAAPLRRLGMERLTASNLTLELVQRRRALQRIKRRNSSVDNLRQDLWTIYGMILESDGLNEYQLVMSNFSEFILSLLQECLGNEDIDHEVKSLLVCLSSLTLSRRAMVPEKLRRDLLLLLRPWAMSIKKDPSISRPSSPYSTIRFAANGSERSSHVPVTDRMTYFYGETLELSCPSLTCASIFLSFALKDEYPLRLPPHLPLSRNHANSTMRLGPTKKDYLNFVRQKTELVADSLPAICASHVTGFPPSDPNRSCKHDLDFFRTLCALRGPSTHLSKVLVTMHYPYSPGLVAGNWEGTFMVSPPITHDVSQSSILGEPPSDFLNRQPMQCNLREHLCVDPAICFDPTHQGQFVLGGLLSPQTLQGSLPHSKFISEISSVPDPRQVLITGETSREHDQAWGAYNFTGKVRLRDGLITMVREPKNSSDAGLGTWIFEGYLHSTDSFVGRWRSSKIVDESGVCGIFCLSRRMSGKADRL